MPHKLYLETFGCQMNVLDSDLVLGQLRARGFQSTDERDEADVVIYNTCSVREHAEQKVWSRLGELRDSKKEKPSLIIGVIGCMAERDGIDLFKRFPHLDLLCGPGELDKLPAMVSNAVATALGDEARSVRHPAPLIPPPSRQQAALMGSTTRRSSTFETAKDDHLELLDLSRAVSPSDDLTQAYVRITRGCNKFCSYCVVPYTRGPEVHRPPQNIVDEVKMLADSGAMEVTLLGQTINHYHFENADGRTTTFADLLYLLHESVPHLPRLRFVTSFPRDFTDEALQAMRDCPRICRYLHAPAQHGADRVLKLMNRGYTVAQYRQFVSRARSYMPDVAIVSDFIVGFPTETEAEFDATMQLVRDCRFKNSFIFKYSARPGTIAIKRFEDDIPEEVKKRRNNALLAVQSEVIASHNRQLIGQTAEVYIEGDSKLTSKPKAYPSSNVELGSGFGKTASTTTQSPPRSQEVVQLVGRTRADQIVVFDGHRGMKGKIVDVEILDARQMTLFARMLVPATV